MLKKVLSLVLSAVLVVVSLSATLVSVAAYENLQAVYITGDNADIFGGIWVNQFEDAESLGNVLASDDDEVYTITKTATQAGDFSFKLVCVFNNGTEYWIENDDGSNFLYHIDSPGDITFTFNSATGKTEISGEGVSIVDALDLSAGVFVAGNGYDNWLNGANWKPDAPQNKMTKISDEGYGIYEITYKEVAEDDSLKFKFTAGTWTNNWGFYGYDEYPIEPGRDTAAYFDGSNIYLDTTDHDLADIKITLDLSNYNHATKKGATFRVDIIDPVEEEKNLDVSLGVFVTGNGYDNWLNGVSWVADDPENKMNKISDEGYGVYEITYKDIEESDNLQFKFTAGSWYNNWGYDSYDSFVLGEYNAATFDGSTIYLDTTGHDLADIKIALDLSNYDHATKIGATVRVDIIDPVEEESKLVVNAISNIASTATGEVEASTETEGKYVTVTYFLNADKDILNTQWVLTYDPMVLRLSSEDNENMMPFAKRDAMYNKNAGKVIAIASDINLYKLENGKAFVQAVFEILADGETDVTLEVEELMLALCGDDGVLNSETEEIVVSNSVINNAAAIANAVANVTEGKPEVEPDVPDVTEEVTNPTTNPSTIDEVDPNPEGTLKVTSTSNFFAPGSTVVKNGDLVTVTYFIEANKDILNHEFRLNYDKSKLSFTKEGNYSEEDGNWIVNKLPNAYADFFNPEIMHGNGSTLKTYKISGKRAPYLSFTFRAIGEGETVVDLYMATLSFSKATDSGLIGDPDTEVAYAVVNGVVRDISADRLQYTATSVPYAGEYNPNIGTGIEDELLGVYITGSSSDLFGDIWVGSLEDAEALGYVLTKGEDGIYTLTKTATEVTDFSFYIVTVNSDYSEEWHRANWLYRITAPGEITFTYNPATCEITATGEGVEKVLDFDLSDGIYAVGNGYGNWLNDTCWVVDATENQMTKISDEGYGVYEITFEDVEWNDDLEFKFTAGDWKNNWGYNYGSAPLNEFFEADFDGRNIVIDLSDSEAVTMTVKLTFDLSNFNYETMTGARAKIDVIEHNEVIIEYVAPTCTEDGHTEGIYCSYCGEYIVEPKIIPAVGHNVVVERGVLPTCTEGGLSNREYCSVCGEVFAEQVELMPKGHKEVVDRAVKPTCTESGLTQGSHCAVCGEVFVEQTEIAPLGHKVVTDRAVRPTCTETGLTEGSHCALCGEVFVEQTEIAPLGHKVVTDRAVRPTCTETGLTEGSHCALCGEVFVEQAEIAPLGHREVIDPGTPATPEQEGLSDGKHCSYCGDVLVDQQVLPVLKPYICGDVNSDGVVSIEDVTMLQKYLAGIFAPEKVVIEVFDVDSDGIITIKDATAISKYIAGFSNSTVIGSKIYA